MRCSSSSTRSSCSRSEPPPRRAGRLRAAALPIALLAGALPLIGGCGEGEGSGGDWATAPEPGGTLAIALADRIDALDPLAELNRGERLASRQVFEPLRSWQSGPFGATRRRPGVVRSFRPDADRSVWTATLRRGVSFQDGEPLDADAVIANADRWTGSAAGRALLPALSAVDSPRPGRVRFILDRPALRFPEALSSPRLGLVSPASLAGISGSALPIDASGTGPFEYRGREHDAVLLARNSDWWGAAFDLGPGVDQVELTCQPVAGHRLAGLLDGAVEVADDLGRNAAERIADAPLLTVVRGAAGTIGIERSVRGIDSTAAAQSLADVWLTDLR